MTERVTHAEKVAGGKVRQQGLLANLWFHDVTERMKIRRKALASEAGLDESYDVGNYPIAEDRRETIIQNGGLMKGLVAGAGLLGGGATMAGLALNALGLLGSAVPPEVKEKAPVEIIKQEVWGTNAELEIVPPQE